MKRFTLILLSVFANFNIGHGQNWLELIDQGANFYDIKKAANDHFSKQSGDKIPGFNQYSRWEAFMEPRVYPSGKWPDPGQAMKEYKRISKTAQNLRQQSFPAWTSKGPNDINQLSGLGRVNFIRYSPADSNILYVGAPAGGLWKSMDGGQTFSVLNDTLPLIGCADLAIDPQNDSILYLGTGDRVNVGYTVFSNGVWKSTNAGYSWQQTGLTWNVSQSIRLSRMAINSLDPEVVFAATSSGIYKTNDGGSSWNLVQSGNFYDIEIMPGDSSILYASGPQFFRSGDGGNSWSLVNFGGGAFRMETAVTPANPAKVYVVACQSGNFGLQGIYLSQDSGQSFSQVHGTTPNILDWSSDGTGVGGQAWYDLAITASPIDENLVVVGGVNVWKSTDGGSNFTFSSYENGIPNSPRIHVDIHYLTFSPSGNHLLVGNDGGIYRSLDSGTTWNDISSTLVITQSYRLGLSQHTQDWFLMGNQDNGTNLSRGTFGFDHVTGGDGMECIISHTDPNLMFSSSQNGPINRSTDGGNSFSFIVSPNSIGGESAQWITPYVMDPFLEDVLFLGYRNIYKTTNKGSSWTQANNSSYPSFGNTATITISKWWPDRILASKGDDLYFSNDGGTNWNKINNSGTPNLTITYVAFDNNDLTGETIWITFGGYSGLSKAYKTTNLGANWTNETSGLPNVPANCVLVDDEGTGGGVYVGTDVGVFYQDDSTGSFVSYSNGLPNVMVFEMEIQQASKKLVAATYGRGIWEVDLQITGLMAHGQKGNLEMLLWPNPTTDFIHLKFRAERGAGLLNISDSKGSLILSKPIEFIGESQEEKLDMGQFGLEPGIYFAQIRSNENQISKKFIVQ